jgi:hypothetical protein
MRKYQAGGKASKKSMKKDRPKPYDEMSTTGALSRVTDGPRPKPYDEMSTTGALSRSSDVTRSLRPVARPERQGATKEGLNPAKSSLRPMARPARKPTADQQELIDYVQGLKEAEAYEERMRDAGAREQRPSEVNEMTPSGKPRTMGERMREAMEMPEMKEGGKVRGYGKARGGKACKMM